MTGAEPSPVGPEERRPIVRSVQRTGLSSLTVTLPKSWTDSFNIRSGSLVRLQDLGEGRLELTPAGRTGVAGTRQSLHLHVASESPGLLRRLLVGAYITGQDHVLITTDREFSPDLRGEVDRTSQHILGMSLIEDEPNRLEVHIFLDPTKHRLSSLLDRVVRMIRLEIDLCRQSLETGDPGPLGRVGPTREEVDRFYLLMARQILLASNDFQVAREIGVPSHHYQLGYRLVVKMLEVTSHLVAATAHELGQDPSIGRHRPELVQELAEFEAALVASMEAFRDMSAARANEALVVHEAWSERRGPLAERIVARSRNKEAAARAQRILSAIGTARALLAIINETTINRAVEPETIARAGGVAMIVGRSSAVPVEASVAVRTPVSRPVAGRASS